MIKVSNLCKSFDQFKAVDKLSFTVSPGDVVGFLGPNGAGKSTTMKMLTGFLTPTSGDIEIFDLKIAEDPLKIKQLIGYLPEGAPAYGDMTPAQFLDFIADVRGLTGDDKLHRIKQVINQVELQSVLHRPIDNLSKGFKRRVGLAQAILHDPKVLILDEPTDGLDPNQKYQVRDLILNLAKDKIVIISTHILEEVSAVCNRAMIIAGGKKLFDGTPEELERKSDHYQAVTIQFAEQLPDLSVLQAIESVAELKTMGQEVTVFAKNGSTIFHDVYEVAKTNNWNVASMFVEKGRLDDVFREMTTNKEAA